MNFREILKEIYQEEFDSIVVHNGVEYRANSLLELAEDLPIEDFNVDELKWILPYFYETIKYDDLVRIQNADLAAPILVTKEHNEYIVLDGIHRLCRAIKDNIGTLPR